jgi:acetate kinase
MILVVVPNIYETTLWAFWEKNHAVRSACLTKAQEELYDAKTLRAVVRRLTRSTKPEAISFRILFGASVFTQPARIDKDFFKRFDTLVPLFPFYVPLTKRLLEVFYDAMPDVPLFAFFETSFFSKLPEEEKYYALPFHFHNTITRTGFHGIFHEANAALFSPEKKIVSIVLDKQTTVAAVSRRAPWSVSLGYTPLEGVMGRTTCGDLDPGIAFYLMKQYGFSMLAIDELLKRKSGFLGLTGYDAPIEELFSLYGKDAKVSRAFDIYQNQLLKYIGEAIVVMGGVDAVVFSGPSIKALTPLIYALLKKISFLGMTLAPVPWQTTQEITCITALRSKVKAYLNVVSLPRLVFYETKNRIQTLAHKA